MWREILKCIPAPRSGAPRKRTIQRRATPMGPRGNGPGNRYLALPPRRTSPREATNRGRLQRPFRQQSHYTISSLSPRVVPDELGDRFGGGIVGGTEASHDGEVVPPPDADEEDIDTGIAEGVGEG